MSLNFYLGLDQTQIHWVFPFIRRLSFTFVLIQRAWLTRLCGPTRPGRQLIEHECGAHINTKACGAGRARDRCQPDNIPGLPEGGRAPPPPAVDGQLGLSVSLCPPLAAVVSVWPWGAVFFWRGVFCRARRGSGGSLMGSPPTRVVYTRTPPTAIKNSDAYRTQISHRLSAADGSFVHPRHWHHHHQRALPAPSSPPSLSPRRGSLMTAVTVPEASLPP